MTLKNKKRMHNETFSDSMPLRSAGLDCELVFYSAFWMVTEVWNLILGVLRMIKKHLKIVEDWKLSVVRILAVQQIDDSNLSCRS
jgi:hypothetical protein